MDTARRSKPEENSEWKFRPLTRCGRLLCAARLNDEKSQTHRKRTCVKNFCRYTEVRTSDLFGRDAIERRHHCFENVMRRKAATDEFSPDVDSFSIPIESSFPPLRAWHFHRRNDFAGASPTHSPGCFISNAHSFRFGLSSRKGGENG